MTTGGLQRLAWALCWLVLVLTASPVFGQSVPKAWRPVSGTASSDFGAPYFLTRSHDGSGISGTYSSGITNFSVVEGFTNAASGDNQWFGVYLVSSGQIVYDLGQTLVMDRVRLFWANNDAGSNNISCLSFDVSSSAAFSTFTTAASGINAVGSVATVSLVPTSGRYLRIRWSCILGWYPGLNEIIVGGLSGSQPAGLTSAAWWSRASSLGLADGNGISTWTNDANPSKSLTGSTTRPVFRNNNAQNINFNPVVEFTSATASEAGAQFFSAPSFLGTATWNSAQYVLVGYAASAHQQNRVFYEDAVAMWGQDGRLSFHLNWAGDTVFWDAGASGAGNRTSYADPDIANRSSV